jgi:hypothetical protein
VGSKPRPKGYGGKAELLVRVLIQKNHPVLFGTKTEVFECHAFFASLPNRQLEVMADRPDRVWVEQCNAEAQEGGSWRADLSCGSCIGSAERKCTSEAAGWVVPWSAYCSGN